MLLFLLLMLLLLSLFCQNGRGNGYCKFGKFYYGHKTKINVLLVSRKEDTGGHKYITSNNIKDGHR